MHGINSQQKYKQETKSKHLNLVKSTTAHRYFIIQQLKQYTWLQIVKCSIWWPLTMAILGARAATGYISCDILDKGR